MSSKHILSQPGGASNSAAPIPTKGTIKHRIRFLRATFGDCLNTWPRYAQTEYHELARQLSRLENGGLEMTSPKGPGGERRQVLEAARALTRLYLMMSEARPDGSRLLDLECETARTMETLIEEMDTGELNEAFYLAATGRSKSYWALKATIEAGGEERGIVQREIDAFIADDPSFAELQVLLDGGE